MLGVIKSLFIHPFTPHLTSSVGDLGPLKIEIRDKQSSTLTSSPLLLERFRETLTLFLEGQLPPQYALIRARRNGGAIEIISHVVGKYRFATFKVSHPDDAVAEIVVRYLRGLGYEVDNVEWKKGCKLTPLGYIIGEYDEKKKKLVLFAC